MQNLSKRERIVIIADDGYKLINADQSGAEAKIVAWLTRANGNYRKLFQYGIKPHVFVALHIFPDVWKRLLPHLDIDGMLNCPIEQLKKFPGFKECESLIKKSDEWPAKERYYFIAKQVCHSSNYEASAHAIIVNTLKKSEGRVALTKREAEGFHHLYNVILFPELGEWQNETKEILRATRTLHNLFGFPRVFNKPWGNDLFKEAFAFVPQSTVGTITNIAFTKMQELIERQKLNWHLLNNCHDSILMEAPESEVNDAAKCLQNFMQCDLISPRKEPFKMGSEVQVGYNWAPRKEHKNPDGSIEVENEKGMQEYTLN